MNINNPFDSLSDIAVFARVVDARSFSGAARQLSLTPSAVSRQIARLEGVLRVQLLVRSTRKLCLAEAGSPAYLAAHGTPTHPRDLSQHSCLYLGENELDCHWRFCRDGEELIVNVSGRYVANQSEVSLDGSLHSLGIASLPEFIARASLASGELVSVLDDWAHATHYVGMAWLL